jgi:hypothetical protein
MKTFHLPGVPCNDAILLRAIADDFKTSHGAVYQLDGCVSALDGIAFAIQRPPKCYNPRKYKMIICPSGAGLRGLALSVLGYERPSCGVDTRQSCLVRLKSLSLPRVWRSSARILDSR